MKRFLTAVIFVFNTFGAQAQDGVSLKQLTKEGQKCYVEFIDVHDNIQDKEKPIITALEGEEWGRWVIVAQKVDADFILHIQMEKKGAGFSTSYGARLFMYPSILTSEGKKLWQGKLQKSKTNVLTGFNAQNDVARKLIRRSLKEELQHAIAIED